MEDSFIDGVDEFMPKTKPNTFSDSLDDSDE